MYFERIFKIAVSQKRVKAFVTCSTTKTVCPLEFRIFGTIFSGNVAGDNLLLPPPPHLLPPPPSERTCQVELPTNHQPIKGRLCTLLHCVQPVRVYQCTTVSHIPYCEIPYLLIPACSRFQFV